MKEMYERTEGMLGHEAVERLKAARVIVIGVGGVGGYTVEALARAGVGSLTIVDADSVAPSNINRQIIATTSTVGMRKVDAERVRILDINPDCAVTTYDIFYSEETADAIDLGAYDYVVDCIDSTRAKIELIKRAHAAGARIISAMGAGNKLDPTRFRVADISKTSGDPFARAVRTALRGLGINHLKVVYSDEEPYIKGERMPMSVSFVPSVMGLIIAGEVIKDIAGIER